MFDEIDNQCTREFGFDLETDCRGGGHGKVYSPYVRLRVPGLQMPFAPLPVHVGRKALKIRTYINPGRTGGALYIFMPGIESWAIP
jgi:hypothetical protein